MEELKHYGVAKEDTMGLIEWIFQYVIPQSIGTSPTPPAGSSSGSGTGAGSSGGSSGGSGGSGTGARPRLLK